jgi:8-oxo-dGTP pyrophosphatase MutT (NUDIX family)
VETTAERVVRAAGGVVTRPGAGGEPEVLLVHRAKYDDWTLPKGKAEPGETDEETALREVEEETGLVCELGAEVGVSEYTDASGRPKRVRYFAMTPRTEQEAGPQNEIDALRWVPLRQTRDALSYERDVEIVERSARFS